MIKKVLILMFILIEIGVFLPIFIAGTIPAFLNNQIVSILFVFLNLFALFGLLI